jgi:hypothetical protein
MPFAYPTDVRSSDTLYFCLSLLEIPSDFPQAIFKTQPALSVRSEVILPGEKLKLVILSAHRFRASTRRSLQKTTPMLDQEKNEMARAIVFTSCEENVKYPQ